MKVQFISDLHLENKTNISFTPDISDILILNGDIHSLYLIDEYKKFIIECEKYVSYIIIVFGNHEYYYREKYGPIKSFEELHSLGVNVLSSDKTIILNNEYVIINGVYFYGSTAWSILPKTMDMEKFPIYSDEDTQVDKMMILEKHILFRDKLSLFLDTVDNCIIITHYCPLATKETENINHPFDENVAQWYFDGYDLLTKKQVIWIAGHTHSNYDFKLNNGTRLISNSFI